MKQNDLKELHNTLVQTCINFLCSHHIEDVDEIEFRADSLQESAKYVKWMPCTDSSLVVYRYEEDENGTMQIKEIGSSY